MEVVFCIFFNFFTQSAQKDQGEDENTAEGGEGIRHQAGKKQGRTAEREKIENSAQKERRDHINAQLTLALHDGIEKKAGGD